MDFEQWIESLDQRTIPIMKSLIEAFRANPNEAVEKVAKIAGTTKKSHYRYIDRYPRYKNLINQITGGDKSDESKSEPSKQPKAKSDESKSQPKQNNSKIDWNVKINIYPETLEKFKDLCQKEYRSYGNQIAYLIEKFVADNSAR